MAFASFKEVLTDGLKHGYAVGQFNVNNLEFLQAIIETAEEERSPVILGVSEGAMKYMNIEYTVAMCKAAAEKASVPVILHLDHGSSYEVVLKCLRAGFSSIMIDASHYPLEENIAKTRQVVHACHTLGVDVEGELGRIGGTEDDLSVDERDATLAKPEEAVRLVQESGIDALAPAIGSAHGLYKGEPKLDFDRLAKIRDLTGVPLVLHGGSGIPDEDIRKAISLGVSKINVNTENQVAFTNKIRELLDKDAKVYDPRKYLGPAREAIKETVREKIRLFGSNNKA
ncbi:class II fructose-1,6-bisphosphate aldolase [Effusibacillus lacus]|uniref:Fructose-1,6-bisphosphate aldolase, class II n=1 Tax=Effusibacillus lacus TaxID=1348429 RepID=A0A292YM72_9BACL|nr:class II fructose-1,6-bisphosphate aldolase [Effusibacillus lacus]TCS70476.1 fructose-bisphosphate aldolase [Effusibacillus lacus]GAX89570.1 fructose-1,6-bisphosphate aldolase, class II [Effusibacillus lacus]